MNKTKEEEGRGRNDEDEERVGRGSMVVGQEQ